MPISLFIKDVNKALENRKPIEERIKNWDKFLRAMFEIEENNLLLAFAFEADYSEDIEGLIKQRDVILEKKTETYNEAIKIRKVLYDLCDRLTLSERCLGNMAYNLKCLIEEKQSLKPKIKQ